MDPFIHFFFPQTKGIDFKNSGAFCTTLVPQFQFSNGKILLLRNAWQHDDKTPAAAAAGVSRPAASYQSNQTGKKTQKYSDATMLSSEPIRLCDTNAEKLSTEIILTGLIAGKP